MTENAKPGRNERPSPQRCGFVTVLGTPNTGKSTLVNALAGSKVAIVSHKVQTTRMPVRGIVTHGDSQVVFIDTPGIFDPRRRLDRAMVGAAWSAAGDADAVIVLVDAAKPVDDNLRSILGWIGQFRAHRVLVLNKVDLVAAKPSLLALTAELRAAAPFDAVFMVSALDGSGVADLKTHLAQIVPPGPWHYPEDDLSDMPARLLAAEITRERIYHWLHDEVPYATTVETTAWKELRDGSVRIEQTIFVERDSQRMIVLGEKGRTIKRISSEARAELGRLLEQPVHLFLFVKVSQNWKDDPEHYREMGLEFPKD